MILESRRIDFSYGSLPVLKQVDISVRPGITAILGPNAAGKSTLLKCLCGFLKPAGTVLLDNRNIQDLRRDEFTRIVSYLPQTLFTHAVLTVFEAVLLGRVHKLGWHVSDEDTAIVQSILEDFDIANLGHRYVTELSGGQAQLVFIAQAIARQPAILLLDEPNTSLDLRHQFEICDRIKAMTTARGLSTALSVHDVNMAARIADYVYVLEGGTVRCAGTPAEVLTAAMLADVYGVDAKVTQDDAGRPCITPVGLKLPGEGRAQ